MKQIKDLAIKDAIHWLEDGFEQLRTPGRGMPDACDSFRIALSRLKKVSSAPNKNKREKGTP